MPGTRSRNLGRTVIGHGACHLDGARTKGSARPVRFSPPLPSGGGRGNSTGRGTASIIDFDGRLALFSPGRPARG